VDLCRRSLFQSEDNRSFPRKSLSRRDFNLGMLSTLCNISDSFVNADTDPRNVLMLQQWNGRSKTCRQLRDEPLVHSDPDWKAAADASFNPRLVSWSKNNLLAVAYGKSIDIVGLSNLHSREQRQKDQSFGHNQCSRHSLGGFLVQLERK
jgi:hypothetical protein